MASSYIGDVALAFRDLLEVSPICFVRNQSTLLTNQRTALNLRMQQLTASVELIKALGGGWNSSQLPTPQELVSKPQPTPTPKPSP